MCKPFFLLLIFLLLLLTKHPLQCGEPIIEKKFSIAYNAPSLKYYAEITKHIVLQNIKNAEMLTGLKFQYKFLITLYESPNDLLQQRKMQDLQNDIIQPDTALSMIIFFTPPNNYYDTRPYSQVILRKLFFVLFRQNNIPEYTYWEEAIFEITANEVYGLGLISTFDNFNPPLSIDNQEIQTILSAKKQKAEPATQENLKIKLQYIQLAKNTLIANGIGNLYPSSQKNSFTIKQYLRKVKSSNFPKDLYKKQSTHHPINPFKRRLYTKVLNNLNYPSLPNTQNNPSYFVFRMTLRLLLLEKKEIAKSLFTTILITPPSTPYFPELGIFLAQKSNEDTAIYLEYYLINQEPKKPIDFNNLQQIVDFLHETLYSKAPDFNLPDEELDLIRTLQYLLYQGQIKLIETILPLYQTKPLSIETKNYLWAIGLLLENTTIKKDFSNNRHFYSTFLWPELEQYPEEKK